MGLLPGSGEVHFSNIKLILLAWLVVILFKNLLSFSTRYLIGSTGETITASLALADRMLELKAGKITSRS